MSSGENGHMQIGQVAARTELSIRPCATTTTSVW